MRLKFKGGPRDGMLLDYKEPTAPKMLHCKKDADMAHMQGVYHLISVESGIAHMLWKNSRKSK